MWALQLLWTSSDISCLSDVGLQLGVTRQDPSTDKVLAPPLTLLLPCPLMPNPTLASILPLLPRATILETADSARV